MQSILLTICPALLVASLSVPCVAGTTPEPEPGTVYTLVGDGHFDDYGSSLVALDDLDGDGAPEFAVGAPERNNSAFVTNQGYIHIHSGRTGSILRTLHGWIDEQAFGLNMLSMGDLNEDGVRELVVIANDGSLRIYAPNTGEEIHELELVDGDTSAHAADAGDLDSDGKPDLFIGN
jgi:hypothetical protein